MQSAKLSMKRVNELTRAEFVPEFGAIFEHSPWVAERAYEGRPFESVDILLDAMWNAVSSASPEDQLKLIRAHPDLVGRAADQAEALTRESAGEQAAAGLMNLSSDEIAAFRNYNQQYWNRFGFPFVICARENKKEAILAAFPKRLANSPQQEMATALAEIRKIGRLRLMDRVE
ncbi:MAG TPA: 2-oxo-4-hydroxy-4-carboxy-5-ureidoimidazoline decarboxylase [Tepidisphaeraceae bacterium]|nr:2-oxo-4-hydroxy-4-carboxy-5-ureidoimidazoline decarboxylase [Tepidisphaeraceae bacterium]